MNKLNINFKDPRLRVPLLVFIISAGGIYYWADQIFKPIRAEKQELETQLKAKQDTLRLIQALRPQLDQLRIELSAAQAHLDSLKDIFPDQKEIPKLIRELTSVARASGIRTTRFNPLPDVEREYYVENRYSISVEGGYHDLAEFFAFLANFTLIINLSTVTISAHPEYAKAEENEVLTVQRPTVASMFEMTTFSSKK